MSENGNFLDEPWPYAKAKQMCEQILSDFVASDSQNTVIVLRSLFVGGSHPSFRLGRDVDAVPNNWLAYITKHALNLMPEFKYRCLPTNSEI